MQRLLQTAAQKLQAPELDPKGVDGKIARPPGKSNTVAAIEAFQSRSNISIDGLIEPGSQTWQALLQAADNQIQETETPPGSGNVAGTPSAVITGSVGRGKKARAIFQRMSRQCNASCKQQHKNYKLLNLIPRASMEKLRNRPGIRTRLLPSKLFRAVPIFRLMD